MSINDDTRINGVRLVAEIDGKEARVRFFAAPIDGGATLLDVEEWYRLARAQPTIDRQQREIRRLRELAQKHGEPLAAYVQRLDALLMSHYEGCRDCNYDHECNECAADGDGDAHSCNCADGVGYGYQLKKTLELARMALGADIAKAALKWRETKRGGTWLVGADADLARVIDDAGKAGK